MTKKFLNSFLGNKDIFKESNKINVCINKIFSASNNDCFSSFLLSLLIIYKILYYQ